MLAGRVWLWALALGGLLPVGPLAAAPSAEQRAEIRAAEAAVRKAGNLYKSKKFAQAGEAIDQAQKIVAGLLAAPNAKELRTPLALVRKQLARAHGLLELEGVKLAPLPADPQPEAAAASTVPAADQVSFSRQVAPLLAAKCGSCHVRQTKGGFSMATFAALEKGSEAGVVLMAGNSAGSRLVEVIASGDMPRGGGKVAPAELALLSRWIDQGARFDGSNKQAPLGSASPPAAPPASSEPMVRAATGKEAVQFARDLGPVLLSNCLGCHGERNPRGQLSLVSFSRLLRGGDSGSLLVPGKPADSLLIKKLRGTAGERMPMGKPPLPDEVIARFEQWIADQARYDGPDPAQPLGEAVALVEARNSTHEQLAHKRADLALRNWRTMLPDAEPRRHETSNFLLLGNVSPELLAEVGQTAEDVLPKLTKALSLPAAGPLVKGRTTLFVFDKRYDYGEIGAMIEKREIPAEWRGHWRYTVVDAYGCVLPAKSQEYGLAPLVAQQIVGVYVASLGQVPRWFSEGSARVAAARIDAKDPRVRQWDQQLPSALAAGAKPDAFLSGGLPPEEADVLSYGFVKSLLGNGPRYAAVLTELRRGTPFDRAFSKSFGGSASQVAASWAARGGRAR
jgi:hypothetical protein